MRASIRAVDGGTAALAAAAAARSSALTAAAAAAKGSLRALSSAAAAAVTTAGGEGGALLSPRSSSVAGLPSAGSAAAAASVPAALRHYSNSRFARPLANPSGDELRRSETIANAAPHDVAAQNVYLLALLECVPARPPACLLPVAYPPKLTPTHTHTSAGTACQRR